jgi:hypothetical protein
MKTFSSIFGFTRAFRRSDDAVGTGAIAVHHALRRVASLLCLGVAFNAQAAPTQTQTFDLRPGWNAIYLEVQPAANTPTEVFNGVPLESVWTLRTPTFSVQFIQNPGEPISSNAEWLRFIPTNRVESFQNTLFRIAPHQAYLVKVTGAAPVTLRVTGQPLLRPLTWKPDAYVLTGLPVDTAAPPSFASFFRGSKAHYDSAVRRLQTIYRLNAGGDWTPVDPDDRTAAGEAFWVFTRGSSEYQGPFSTRVLAGDGLEFGSNVPRLGLTLANLTSSNLNLTLRDIVAPGANLLSYSSLNVTNGMEYLPLPTPFSVSLAPGDSTVLFLTIRRQAMAGPNYETVLEATDGAGTHFLVPVTAAKVLGAAEAKLFNDGGGRGIGLLSAAVGKLSPPQEAQSHAGLWSGTITVNAVSEAHAADPNTPTPVAKEFNLRVLLHVDTNGVARLLKEVIQMSAQGRFTNDANGNRVKAEADRFVLVTDFSKLGQFKGVALRDGVGQGRRLCSVGFDFAASNTNNFVVLNGSFAVGQTVSGRLNVPSTQPTNPFLHRFHPDHDNLAADFKQFKEEAYPVTRAVQFEFRPAPADSKTVDYGYNEIAGIYRETLSGLHRRDLKVSGTFQLNRLTTVGVLNQ